MDRTYDGTAATVCWLANWSNPADRGSTYPDLSADVKDKGLVYTFGRAICDNLREEGWEQNPQHGHMPGA
jgi:hypothetical protein